MLLVCYLSSDNFDINLNEIFLNLRLWYAISIGESLPVSHARHNEMKKKIVLTPTMDPLESSKIIHNHRKWKKDHTFAKFRTSFV